MQLGLQGCWNLSRTSWLDNRVGTGGTRSCENHGRLDGRLGRQKVITVAEEQHRNQRAQVGEMGPRGCGTNVSVAAQLT